MNYRLILPIAILLASCNEKKPEPTKPLQDPVEITQTPPPQDDTYLIVPGTSVGGTMIGSPVETLSKFGKPDFSDSAMGKAWLVWYGDDKNEKTRDSRLMVYTTYKNDELKEKVISEVRVTSGELKTKTGNGSGKNFEDIKKEFPELAEVAKYHNHRTNKDIYIYDAPSSGIAFEFVSYEGDYAKCVAVVVYDKSKKLTTDYIMNLPERVLPGGE